MKKFLLIAIVIFIGSQSYSQTIINAERLLNGVDSSIYSISLSYNGTRGNSTTDQLQVSPALILLRKKNEFKIFGGYSLLSESETEILNGGFFHLRHNFRLTERLKTFEFYQLQFNEVLLLNKREVFGAGLRYSLVDKDSLKVNFNFGVMRELEILNEDKLQLDEMVETTYYRGSFVNSFMLMISKIVKIDNVIYYQPYLKDFSDYRFLNDFTLSVSINSHLSTNVSVSTRYDSNPPANLKNTDNLTSLGFSLKF